MTQSAETRIKGFFIGETLALIVCALAGVVVQFVF